MDISEEIIQKSTRPATKRKYELLSMKFEDWVSNKHPGYSEDGKLARPVTTDIFIEYLGFVSQKKDGNGDVIPDGWHSVNHVGSIRSAVVDLYKRKRWAFSTETEILTKRFMQGYRRQIADMKERGDLPMREGKAPLSTAGLYYIANKALLSTEDLGMSVFTFSM